jgi:hypothetical protein
MTTPLDGESAFADMTVLARAYQVSKMIQVAASLGLADRLSDGPLPVVTLAEASGADAAALLRLCRALASFGIFAVSADGEVSQTPRSESLRQDATPSVYHAARYWTSPHIWTAWSQLEYAVRTGDSAFEAAHHLPKFDYLRQHPDEAELFDLFMQHSPEDRHEAVAAVADLSGVALAVDVGGGNGALLTALLRRNSELTGVVFDTEEVVAGAGPALETFPGRLRAVAGSFFDQVPPGGDAYLMSQVLHDWDDPSCRRILSAVRAAMEPGRRLLIVERLLAPDSSAMHYLSDINMMVNLHGRERTLPEFTQLLAETGFGAPTVVRTRGSFSILEASSI